MVDVRAVRVARRSEKRWCLRWVATHSITGPSTAIEPSAASTARTVRLVLKLRWVNSRWIADRDPDPGEHVGDREHEQVLPVQGSAPRQPSRQDERGGRQAEDHDPHDPLGHLVLDRDHLRGTACRRVSNWRDAHAAGPSCARPRSRRGSPARAGFRRRSRFSATTNARSSWNRRAKLVTPGP